MLRQLAAITTAALLGGCAGMVGVAPPGIDEFPQQEFTYRVAGTQDQVLQEIQSDLTRRGLPSTVTIRSPKIFVITTYIEEPRNKDDRRVRRTAFRFGLAPSEPPASPPCTSISVVSLTKSRGTREEVWSVQEGDASFVSSAWPELKGLIEKRACK